MRGALPGVPVPVQGAVPGVRRRTIQGAALSAREVMAAMVVPWGAGGTRGAGGGPVMAAVPLGGPGVC